MKKIEEKTTVEMVLDALLVALIPMALASIWFLTQVKWWC